MEQHRQTSMFLNIGFICQPMVNGKNGRYMTVSRIKMRKKSALKNDQDELSLLIKPSSPDTYNITARGDGCTFEGSTGTK